MRRVCSLFIPVVITTCVVDGGRGRGYNGHHSNLTVGRGRGKRVCRVIDAGSRRANQSGSPVGAQNRWWHHRIAHNLINLRSRTELCVLSAGASRSRGATNTKKNANCVNHHFVLSPMTFTATKTRPGPPPPLPNNFNGFCAAPRCGWWRCRCRRSVQCHTIHNTRGAHAHNIYAQTLNGNNGNGTGKAASQPTPTTTTTTPPPSDVVAFDSVLLMPLLLRRRRRWRWRRRGSVQAGAGSQKFSKHYMTRERYILHIEERCARARKTNYPVCLLYLIDI